MEAKDTVMDISQIKAAIRMRNDLPLSFEAVGADFERVAQAQAEISFKAGIREVVEFVEPYLRSLSEMVVVMKNLNIVPTETTIKNIEEYGKCGKPN